MKRLFSAIATFASLILLLSMNAFAVNPATDSGGRIVSVFHYANGMMTAVFDKDNNTYMNYENGKLISKTLGSPDGPATYTATYQDGKLVSSVNQYGDTTTYDEFGRQKETSHTLQDYDDETGDPIPGTKSTSVTTYSYDQYGRMTGSQSLAVKKNADGTETRVLQNSTSYSYDGSFMTVSTSYGYSKEGVRDQDPTVTTFKDGRAATTKTVTNGVWDGKITYHSYDPVTGRQTDTIKNEATGAVVGHNYYDQFNRISYSTDMDGNITNEYKYSGAKLTQVITYLNPTKDTATYLGKYQVTQYDEWGNQQFTKEFDSSPVDRTQYDPWTQGTLQWVDGNLALVVDPSQVGDNFYNMDPSELTNGTKMTEDGKLIFMIACDDKATQEDLSKLVGKQIKLLWQYFTASDNKSNSTGYAWLWLANKSDGAVDWHLKNDDASQVQAGGFTWDGQNQWAVGN
ncbi:MAG: hypothetical protein ACYC5N_04940 [Endomicrobiales bacterium]